MARPRADAEKVNRAIAAVRSGAPLADAASREGIGLSTLKRALLALKTGARPAVTAPTTAPAPLPATAPQATQAIVPRTSVARAGIESAIATALADAGDDPAAKVIGAMLGELGASIGVTDPAKLPQMANAVRTLTTTLREMRPPRPPSPDMIEERLRELDRPAREMIERYVGEADKLFAKRLAALKAWGEEHLSPELADELAGLVDGLTAPPEPTPQVKGTA